MKLIISKINIIHTRGANIMNNSIEKVALRFILGSFAALAILYVFILGNMVKNIIERRSFETNIRSLSSEVGDLELTYLSMSNGVDLPFSYSLGFKEAKATFATRKTLGFKPVDNVELTQNGI